MDVFEEEKRYKEGKQLALELLRHGASNAAIAKASGINVRTVYDWRNELRANGWSEPESYHDPNEFQRKLEKLGEYNGLYSQKAKTRRSEMKKELYKELLLQGKSRKEMLEILGVSRPVLRRWDMEFAGEESPAESQWKRDWCNQWDEFMSRLERPIRMKGKKHV